ncbi:hypothetical protein ETD86_45785 [Nonomuraea turkmeniaca]|uniref:Uncharacterized protein n=1 Tax=Nonomuraea turkmeniaca TaxID=103838 RepID=A0A5S4EYX9_9ACTN|nr:hypothetical protein [Nonomuraea turkmeniaca]TMR08887.1 hypothetical protein ETD86_45785 [Nonomuraea turkmeniaca]
MEFAVYDIYAHMVDLPVARQRLADAAVLPSRVRLTPTRQLCDLIVAAETVADEGEPVEAADARVVARIVGEELEDRDPFAMRRWADGEDEVWKVFAMDGDSYPRRYPKPPVRLAPHRFYKVA